MTMIHFDTKAPMILDTLWFETIALQDTWHLAENVIIDTSFEKLHPTDILQHIFYVHSPSLGRWESFFWDVFGAYVGKMDALIAT